MKAAALAARRLQLPFHAAFAHAAARRDRGDSLWVEVADAMGRRGCGEGCPRAYVTGETAASCLAFVDRHRRQWLAGICDVADLAAWADEHEREIDCNPAAWAATELAFLDLFGRQSGKTVEQLLGLPPLAGRVRYSAVLGDGEPEAFRRQLQRYRQAGFTDFKFKLAGDPERDRAKLAAFAEFRIDAARVRADANNLWPDAAACLSYLAGLGCAFHAIEEPLPARDWVGMARVAEATGLRIVLDESVCCRKDLWHLPDRKLPWVVNARVSKLGGLRRSMALVTDAQALGLDIVIGAHVGESSLLTRAALALGQACPRAPLAREGAFGTLLLEADAVTPSLTFGAGGWLSAAQLSSTPGFGLEPGGGTA